MLIVSPNAGDFLPPACKAVRLGLGEANRLNDTGNKKTEMMMDTLANVPSTLASFNQASAKTAQGHAEAVMQSSRIWASGCQAISQTMAAAAQAHFEDSMAAWKAMGSVKSPKEAMDLNMGLARTAFEKACSGTTSLAAASTKLMGETLGPLAARLTHAA